MLQMTASPQTVRLPSMRSGALLQEARLRAGLTQYELAARTGRDRAVIARWEQEVVSPSLETLVELLRACGFDLEPVLVPYETERNERLSANLRLSPERRLEQLVKAIVAAFERQGASYVLVGALARILQGADELTRGVDLTPSLREKNLERVEAALASLEAEAADRPKTPLRERIERGEEVIAYRTRGG